MGLNTVRLEGKLENDHFLDFADRNGILIMAGWCCCDHWEKWDKWKPEDRHHRRRVAAGSAVPAARATPACSSGSTPATCRRRPTSRSATWRWPQEVRWPNPIVSSAAPKKAEHSGDSGVKMWGPYEWVPPALLAGGHASKGGAYGFNTETSPGPAVPPIESLRKMLPPDKLWPINEYWDFHAGGGAVQQHRRAHRRAGGPLRQGHATSRTTPSSRS